MQKHMKRAAVLLLWIAPLLCAQDGATVEGTITNRVTQAPLGGVAVTLSMLGQPRNQYSATTDASGAYRIANVRPGPYQTQFEKSGFLPPPKTSPFEPGLRVASEKPIRLDLQLTPLATLRGRVFDPEGKPATRVEVGSNELDTTETNTDGEFALTEVHPGSYTLFAKPKPAAAAISQDGKRTEVALTYYPSATDPAQAQPIRVHGGDDLSGFEIRLAASAVYRVRGVVVDRSGAPAPHADVSLRSARHVTLTRGFGILRSTPVPGQVSFSDDKYFLGGGISQLQEADVETDSHGVFEFPSVRPGEWFVRVESAPAHDGLTMTGGAVLTVSEKDIDDFQVRFSSLFSLRGTVDWGDRPPPEASRQAALMLVSDGNGRQGAVASDGTILFGAVIPGRYRIVPMPGGPPGYYVASVFLGNQDILGQSVDLNPDPPPLRVVYKPNAGTVNGTVEKGAGATVLLWPQIGGTPDLVRAATCDERGLFRFDSVPPGSYSVLAFDTVNTAGDSDAFLQTVLSTAASARVEEDSTATVQLSVIHWPD